MNRAMRRHETERIKRRVVRQGLDVMRMKPEQMTPEWAGKTAAMHWTCMCGWCRSAGSDHHRKPDEKHIDDWGVTCSRS